MNETIEIIRAALQPGADAATRERAAVLVRGVLSLLEQKSVSPVIPRQETVTGRQGQDRPVMPAAASAPHPEAASVLDSLIAQLRAYVPDEDLATMPRFRCTFVRVPG